jgi:hypothetical protein
MPGAPQLCCGWTGGIIGLPKQVLTVESLAHRNIDGEAELTRRQSLPPESCRAAK